MSYRRRLTTPDVLREPALGSNSNRELSDTDESADFLPNESDSESNGVERKTLDQPSTSTGRQILMKSVCLQNYAPLQDGHHVVTMATKIQFSSPKRVMSTSVSHFKICQRIDLWQLSLIHI